MEKILSCFIDEAGDFGKLDKTCPFYYVAIVLHDQNVDISKSIEALDERMSYWGYPMHAIHTGPLIRRESFYSEDEREKRRSLFNALFHFTRKLDLSYVCPRVDKRILPVCDDVTITDKLSKEIKRELESHVDYFNSFDKIIVYYDNGQRELTKIIASVFNSIFDNVEYRRVKPVDYKLFQVADLLCTMELIKEKADRNSLSKSEENFFGKPRNFKKNIYKYLETKKLQ